MTGQQFIHETEEVIETLRSEPELMEACTHGKSKHVVLSLRNVAVSVAFLLFMLSFFLHDIHGLLRGVAYLFGACAYFFELLLLTDSFSSAVDHKELFMAYCFCPLYILMGIAYLLEA